MNDAIILGIVGLLAIAAMQIVAIWKPNGADRIDKAVTVCGMVVGFAFGAGVT